jgi:hypothetical protein
LPVVASIRSEHRVIDSFGQLTATVVNKQVSGAQKPRLDLFVAYSSLIVTYVSLAVTSLG